MTNNKQQGAVDWLFDKMYDPTYPAGEQINWLEHAKEMQKEQIKKAFRKGMVSNKTFDDYYNETYRGGEQ